MNCETLQSTPAIGLHMSLHFLTLHHLHKLLFFYCIDKKKLQGAFTLDAPSLYTANLNLTCDKLNYIPWHGYVFCD